MILAGYLISRFSIENHIPIPYRCQDKFSTATTFEFRHYALSNFKLKQQLRQSYYSTKPFQHSSLGLKSYVQFTSPIRRYGDLLAHYQITSFLKGDKLIPEEEMSNLIGQFTNSYRQSTQIMRQNKSFWQNKYINSLNIDSFQCLFLRWLRPNIKLALVFVSDLFIEYPLIISGNHNFDFGEEIRLKNNGNYLDLENSNPNLLNMSLIRE